MQKRELVDILLKAAEISGHSEFVIIVTLRKRYLEAPRVTKDRLSEGMKDIDEAFARKRGGPSLGDS